MFDRLVTVIFAGVLALGIFTHTASAQTEPVWIQIEAQPNLTIAQERLRDYSETLDDLNGFAMSGGWYGIALGPYNRADAEQILRELRIAGRVPRDSYIAFANAYNQQFWPVGSDTLTAPVATPGTTPTDTAEVAEPVADQPIIVQLPDESPAEARRSEAQLTRDEKRTLQEQLKWAGFYTAAIDGSFGRGTRRSMSDWQAANGFEVTGILTTAQRTELARQYNAVLDGLNMQAVADLEAGVEIVMPTGAVEFSHYEPPFAHYNASGDIDAKVLIISQPGDRDTLYGLYDIMQTLEIVPLEGPRKREKDSFILVGTDEEVVSHTQAWLKNGEIKGFSLVWPAGDEERRARVLGLMQESFTRLEGVLDPGAGDNNLQDVNLVAGLDVRTPIRSQSGFYVDDKGTFITSTAAIAGCGRITVEGGVEAELLHSDDAYGLAVLSPKEQLAPADHAELLLATPRLKSDVAVAGYSYGGVLGAPTVTYGALADISGLNGEDELSRLTLAALPGDIGGPVFDAGGAVMGMLLPATDAARQLPEGVSFALDAAPIGRVLQDLGISLKVTEQLTQMAPEDLTDRAAAMTVLVSCWD